MSRSPMSTRPEESRITPVRAFINVDLPDPFGPTTDATVRGATETDTPWMMSPAPYPALMSSARSDGSSDKVRLHHLGTGPQGRHRPGRQHGAFGHHDHRVAELVHDGQFVLHHEDGHTLGAQAEQLGPDLAREPRVDPGHRLAEQQYGRLGHQRAHDLGQPALTAAQAAGV